MSVALSILNSLSNGVVAVDRDLNIIVFNDAAANLLGVSQESVLGKNLLNLLPDARLVNVLQTGKSEIGQLQVIGERAILGNRSPIFHNNLMIGAVSIFQDLADVEKISGELNSNKILVRTMEEVFTAAGEWMVVVDASGKITMISQGYAEFNGVTVKEALGKHVTEVIENTRMHVVAQTGIAEVGEAQTIKGRNLIVNRIPLKEGGRVVGAYGRVVFKNVEQLWEMAAKVNLLESKVRYYEKELKDLRGVRYTFSNIIGSSTAIAAAKNEALWASQTGSTVLLRGETGTGKELFAHAIHAAGQRHSGPFIKLNCAAIPAELLESELFGYEDGAFTGAKKGGKPGKFEMAAGGTLFLDEIGDMPLPMQAKLLRALQEREVERLGGTRALRINIRIISATAQNLEELVAKGSFRSDLYYRIHVIPILIPPLRDRREDIPIIAEHFLESLSAESSRGHQRISSALMEILQSHSWPGNVRELQNVLEHAATMSCGCELTSDHAPAYLLKAPSHTDKEAIRGSLASTRAEAERKAIMAALDASGGNKSRAAKLLGIHRVRLYEKIKRYGLKTV